MNAPSTSTSSQRPEPLGARQRRILGVLIEKARTTPDAYPLSLNGLVTGANQKSNRSPLMSLTPEQVEDELIAMRERGVVAEVHGGGRVPKYRHYGYDYLGVKGVEAAVMTELLLRGEQTVGDLRSRASRFEPIADLPTLQSILQSLNDRQLVIFLTPAGRGQMVTHNLYLPSELDQLKAKFASGTPGNPSISSRTPREETTAAPETAPSQQAGLSQVRQDSASQTDLATLRQELADIRLLVEQLSDRVSKLEN